jgi:hypothetical protein
MGNTSVKLYVIIISYVYKKIIIIIEHRFRHKFQICKRMASQILNLITNDNMICLQNWLFLNP